MKTFRQIAQDMSLRELAAALGASVSSASMVRTGKRRVTIRRLWSFVQHVGQERVDILRTVQEEATREADGER